MASVWQALRQPHPVPLRDLVRSALASLQAADTYRCVRRAPNMGREAYVAMLDAADELDRVHEHVLLRRAQHRWAPDPRKPRSRWWTKAYHDANCVHCPPARVTEDMSPIAEYIRTYRAPAVVRLPHPPVVSHSPLPPVVRRVGLATDTGWMQ